MNLLNSSWLSKEDIYSSLNVSQKNIFTKYENIYLSLDIDIDFIEFLVVSDKYLNSFNTFKEIPNFSNKIINKLSAEVSLILDDNEKNNVYTFLSTYNKWKFNIFNRLFTSLNIDINFIDFLDSYNKYFKNIENFINMEWVSYKTFNKLLKELTYIFLEKDNIKIIAEEEECTNLRVISILSSKYNISEADICSVLEEEDIDVFELDDLTKNRNVSSVFDTIIEIAPTILEILDLESDINMY